MLYLLQTLANTNICKLYPCQNDQRKEAMLSRIRFIRNEVTQNVDDIIKDEKYNQYWDDIGQVGYHCKTPSLF